MSGGVEEWCMINSTVDDVEGSEAELQRCGNILPASSSSDWGKTRSELGPQRIFQSLPFRDDLIMRQGAQLLPFVYNLDGERKRRATMTRCSLARVSWKAYTCEYGSMGPPIFTLPLTS